MNHWTSYWRSGHALSSFAEGECAFGYNGDVLEVWEQCWRQLPDHAQLLDVGTGNGALAVALARAKAARSSAWNITGIDLADIEPAKVMKQSTAVIPFLDEIMFIGNCSIESTPFADEQFDGIFSQFGLEYANWEMSLPELFRITKSTGFVAALIHSSESELSEDTALGINILSHCLHNSDLLPMAKQLLERSEYLLQHQIPVATDRTFQHTNQALLAEVKQLQQQFGSGQAAIWFQDVLSRLVPLMYQLQPGNLQRLHEQFQALEQHRCRLLDQQSAMLSPEKIAELIVLAQSCSWDVVMDPIALSGKPFAIWLELKKLGGKTY